MRSKPATPDLFGGEDAPAAIPHREEGGSEAGTEASKPAEVSIEAFAKLQANYREAAVRSATAYWAKRGKVWP